jgi:hypothetical protein
VAALLVLAKLAFLVLGAVGLLGGHRQAARHVGGQVVAAAQPAKHAGWLGGLLVGGQGLLGLLAVGGGAFELAGAVAGGLVELTPQPVPLSAQLGGRHSLEIWAARGIHRQCLPASPRQGLGQLQVASGCSRSGRSSSPAPWGSGPTTAYRRVSWRARDSCIYSQLTSSVPVNRTRARPRVNPWARWPVVT